MVTFNSSSLEGIRLFRQLSCLRHHL